MKSLSIFRFGFGFAVASVILYIGCIIFMATVSRETSVTFFNSLMHGMDIEPVLRESVPFKEALLGIVNTFVVAWLFGAIMAVVYNFCPLCKCKCTEKPE